MITELTHSALQDRRLQRCLICDAVNILPLSGEWLRPKGLLYNLAKKEYGFLQENKLYPFHNYVSLYFIICLMFILSVCKIFFYWKMCSKNKNCNVDFSCIFLVL